MAGVDIISDSTGKEIVAAIQSTDVAQARISEINAAAELKKNEVLESIPDYSNIVNEVDELKQDIEVERARIDSFTKLPEGSTTGDAELQDIRVKADGTTATSAGNAVREQVGELNRDLAYLTSVQTLEPTILENTFVRETGKGMWAQSGKTAVMFSIEKGRSYKITATNETSFGYSPTMYNESHSSSGLALDAVGVFSEKIWISPIDGYLYANATNITIAIISKDNSINELRNELSNVIDTKQIVSSEWTIGTFVDYSGTVNHSSSSAISRVVQLNAFDKILLTAKGYRTSVAMISTCDEDMNNIKPVVISDGDERKTYEYMATENCYVVMSCDVYAASNPVIEKVITSERYKELKSDIAEVNSKIKNVSETDIFPFVKVGIVGDSLASGASNYDTSAGTAKGGRDNPDYSWGKYMGREHGLSVELYTKGGITTRDWLSGSYGIEKLQNDEVRECYYIGLGQNDYYKLGSSYLGTVSDVHVGSESENGDTYYGNYSKIIASLKSKSPRCKIFCFTEPNVNNNSVCASFNSAIRDIVAMYDNVYLLDLEGNEKYKPNGVFYKTMYGGHFQAIGYKLMSDYIYKMTSDFINDNYESFMDVQWIINDYPH